MSTKPAYQRDKLEIPTSEAHQKQTLWQIWVPLGATIAIIIGLAVWVTIASANNIIVADNWMALSVAYLVLIYLVIGLIVLAVIAGGIWLAAKLLKLTPYYSLRAMTFLYRIQGYILQFSNSGAKIIIAIASAWTGLKTALKDLGVVQETE